MQSLHLSSQAVLSEQRRNWFVSEMYKERSSFTNDKDLTLFAGTWNVNGRSPDSTSDLSPWLLPDSTASKPLDVYMISLQEIQVLTGVDAVRSDSSRATAWRKAIHATLGSDYDRVAERQLVGILVLVFIRKNHSPYLSNVQISYAATGFLNAVGNKGGVAARFLLYDRTIACVACHLAAHTANVERRTQDFRDVVRKAVFLPVTNDLDEGPSLQNTSGSKSFPQGTSSALIQPNSAAAVPDALRFSEVAAGTAAWLGSFTTAFSDISAGADTTILNDPNAIKVLDHDIVFWLGDLNYRIEGEVEDVLTWIKNRDWSKLYSADQLQYQMRNNKIFYGFCEGPLRFPPTYKYERFSNEYAADENGEMKRVPAYTDRILWRLGTNDDDPKGMPNLRLQKYTSATSVFSSDHRPVSATFLMTFGVEDVSRRKTVEENINRELDRRQANIKPSLQFSPSSVDLGDVFFDQECSRHIIIRNHGSISSFFSIATSEPPLWLFFDFARWQNIELPPGKSVTVPIRVAVDEKDGIANYVTSNGCSLETTLDLSAEPGNLKKTFQIRGRYVPTVLGLSLEMLSMSAEPIMSLRASRNDDRDNFYSRPSRNTENENQDGPGVVPFSIPKELWLLVDGLMAVHEGSSEPLFWFFPNMFLKRGEETEVQRALSLIDRGQKIPEDITGYAIGTCLLRVLQYLDDPVIPNYAYKRAIEAGFSQDEDVVCGLIDLLPPLNRNVFWYLIGFLCELPVVQDGEERGRDIAMEFGKVLIRSNAVVRNREEQSKEAFVHTAMQRVLASPSPRHSVIIDLANPESHPRAHQRIRK